METQVTPVTPGRARIRRPAPLLAHRLPSGRGATEQPNASGDGSTPLTVGFWIAVVLTGIAAGLFGAALMALLHAVQHLAFGYHRGDFEAGVLKASPTRRLVALTIGGAVTGVAWYVVRRVFADRSSELDDVLWTARGELSFRRSAATSVVSEIAVGAGASLGREAAPKLMGAASGSVIAGWMRLSPAQRRLLLACGGGAGMAAVYNVPLGGALITAEVLFGSLALPVALPALACSVIATVTAWVYLPNQAVFLRIPTYSVHAGNAVWAVPAGLVIGVLAVAQVRLIGWVSAHRPKGFVVAVLPTIAFAAVGAIAWHYPQLLGNGKNLAHPAFLGLGSLGLLVTLAALKPLATALCLGSGATGGLFTPTLATGAAVGAALGIVWSHAWSGTPIGAYAVIGAAAMVGAALQAPLSGLVLVLELTRTSDGLLVPMMIAVVLATVVARVIDGYSIYSARLPAI